MALADPHGLTGRLFHHLTRAARIVVIICGVSILRVDYPLVSGEWPV
jgi:hypothetical protein